MEILTPSGFQPFDGIGRFDHHADIVQIQLDDFESDLECALDHKFVYDEQIEISAKNVKVGDHIGGKLVLQTRIINRPIPLYSPINVGNGSVYYHDDFIPSTQTFFGTGETLIGAEYLIEQRKGMTVEILEGGSCLVYKKVEPGHEYIMTVDVAKGRGQDYSTFNIIDVTTRPFEQACVYRNNLISPLLYPDMIYKYANVYNQAYVIIEANDQGALVANGLYNDLEYENVHMDSAIKADRIGVEMNKKIKRLGCSGIKDIIENRKLKIYDQQTIMEMSTFVAIGQSYQASEGNHDDLMMNLVLFGYFAITSSFALMTNINIKQMLHEQRMLEIEQDVIPFGFIEDGLDPIEDVADPKSHWQVNKDWVNYDIL